LSGRGLCDGPIPRPEESYRLWCVSECDQVKINNLDTYREQVGRRGKDYETSFSCNFVEWNSACFLKNINDKRDKLLNDYLHPYRKKASRKIKF
jgi:hypothetical protein